MRVPLANTIGEVGHGFQQQMMQFQDERLVACISAVAGSLRLWELTRDYAKERMLFGKPLSKMQVSQFKFVEMRIQLEAARELTSACVRKRIKGEDATREISMAKVFCGRTIRYVADECMQLHGGYGYMKESAAGRARGSQPGAPVGSDVQMMPGLDHLALARHPAVYEHIERWVKQDE